MIATSAGLGVIAFMKAALGVRFLAGAFFAATFFTAAFLAGAFAATFFAGAFFAGAFFAAAFFAGAAFLAGAFFAVAMVMFSIKGLVDVRAVGERRMSARFLTRPAQRMVLPA
jgi:hypothetical protein